MGVIVCVYAFGCLSPYFLPCLHRAHDFSREMLFCEREEEVENE